MIDVFRILVVIVLAVHGIGHIIWFLAAWTGYSAGVRDGRWILPGNVTIRSPLGKVWGILALLAMTLFVAAALALLGQVASWRQLAYVGALLSSVTVVPWLRQSPGSTAINAIIANLAVMFVLALPLSDELIGAA